MMNEPDRTSEDPPAEEDLPPTESEDQEALEGLLGEAQESEGGDGVGDLDGLMGAVDEAQDRGAEMSGLAGAMEEQHSLVDVAGVSEEDLQRILKLKVPLAVVLAEKDVIMREILGFQAGTLIEFEKLNDELLEIHLNEQLMGLGEVVKTHEHFGIRLKEIIPMKDRIKKMGL